MSRLADLDTRLFRAEPSALAAVDLDDPAWRVAVLGALSKPAPITTTEAIELAVKDWWAEKLEAHAGDAKTSSQFSKFFGQVGFLKKYKPYGIKFAAPFGYSIFLLQDGMGFSIQLHRVPKVEAFHILRAGTGSLVLLCGVDEWRAHREDLIRELEPGTSRHTSLTFEPEPGDVVVVDDIELVHTVLGCILEEYATTSNDAVERLFDQNLGVETVIPDDHPSLRALLAECGGVQPRSRLLKSASASAWTRSPLDSAAGSLVDMPEQGLRADHLVLGSGESRPVSVDEDRVCTLTCLVGGAVVALPAGEVRLGPADTTAIAPGEHVSVQADVPGTRVAVCTVPRDMAFGDFRSSLAGRRTVA
ncbi:MAG: hypothetical protein ABR540_15475 [Acidimicrobiales bacterium]